MTVKQKAVPGSAQTMKKPAKRAKPVKVNEGLAVLIEDAYQKADTMVAVKNISTQIQDMAEKLAKVEPIDLMPMMDSLNQSCGEQNAQNFYQAVTTKLRELVTAVQAAKGTIDGEISRLVTGAGGGDTSDAAMDGGMPTPPPADDGLPAPEGAGEGDVPGAVPGAEAPVPPMPPEPPANGATGFAGRARKESARVKGRRLTEGNVAEAPEFLANMDAVGEFSPKCVNFASDIINQIHDLSVSGEVRNKLMNSLGHVLSMAAVPDVWDDPEAVASHGVSTHFADGPMGEVAKAPEITKIIKDITKLAHMVSLKHGGHLSEVDAFAPPALPAAPATAPAPRATPLAPGPVFESRLRARNIKRLRESRNPDKMILTVFRRVFHECRNVGLAVSGTARAFGIDAVDVATVVREAKRGFAEDAVPSLMGLPMGEPDPDMNNALAGQNPSAANPVPGKPNKPLSPSDMRAAKQAREIEDKKAQAAGLPNKPIVAPKAPVPVRQVQGRQTMNPVMSPQARQQFRANMPRTA